jgi:hypothetical protein
MHHSSRPGRIAAAVAVGLVLSAAAAAPAQAQDTATVSILHAVPGATVDVYANGKSLLTNFKPGTLTAPQQLPAGDYDLKVVKAGAGASAKPVAELDNATVPAGANLTVVAHLTKGGKPTLNAYANDVSTVPAGQARLIVRHDAAAPAVDVRAGKKPVITGLKNPQQAAIEVPAGTVRADVVLAGTDKVAIGPASLNLKEGTTTIVYAWGSAKAGDLALATQVISGMQQNPSGVPGGTGGQAATSSSHGAWPVATLVAGMAGLALFAVRTGLRRVPVRR